MKRHFDLGQRKVENNCCCCCCHGLPFGWGFGGQVQEMRDFFSSNISEEKKEPLEFDLASEMHTMGSSRKLQLDNSSDQWSELDFFLLFSFSFFFRRRLTSFLATALNLANVIVVWHFSHEFIGFEPTNQQLCRKNRRLKLLSLDSEQKERRRDGQTIGS